MNSSKAIRKGGGVFNLWVEEGEKGTVGIMRAEKMK